MMDVKVSPAFAFKQFTVKTGAAGKPAAPASAAGAAQQSAPPPTSASP
jgi:hypothetical protein